VEDRTLLVRNLAPGGLRRDDPFVRAVVGHFERFAAEHGPLAGSVQGYLAGGLGVRCHAGMRVTGDIDMFFVGGRILMPPNTTILVRAAGREHGLVFDQQYTPDFGLLHPDHGQRAIELASLAEGRLKLLVLHPVDLAVTKIARFQDHDREDIAALARTGAFDAPALGTLGEEAMAYAIGNLSFARANLAEACELVAAVQREAGPLPPHAGQGR
jgi:hypothetical protein